MSSKAKYSASDTAPWKFANAGDIRTALSSPDIDLLTRALTALRNKLNTPTSDSATLPLQDPRLLLAKSWFEASPGAGDIFSIIDRVPQSNTAVLSLCLAILSLVLNLFSAHFIHHPLGAPVVKNLISPTRMRQLNSNLASTSSELISSTLKLFNQMSTYAGSAYQRSVMDSFAWGQKSSQKLLFLRRKGGTSREIDPISQPDIRTLYVFFILSFLSHSSLTSIKVSMLEQHRDVFLLIFKGISRDPYTVVRHILETCWECVLNDQKIKRSLKVGLFSEQTMNHLLKLYARDSPENNNPEHIPADLVHHFILALTTRPGVGICFRDRGWYPREHTLEEEATKSMDADPELSDPHTGKINNKILSNIIKCLKVNEDARQQELVLKMLEACPELVAGYWGGVNLTLEPRLSSRWITNIAVFGMIISLPIPTHCFLLPNSEQYNPSPPPISSTLSNVYPSVMTKTHLTKGLQSPSKLVQHCTALALSKCLTKLQRVLMAFQEVARQLEEDEESGLWSNCWRQLKAEVERRVPDSMVIIAMLQQKHQDERERSKPTLLGESALRLLWLYQKIFPRFMAEIRFDVGKLLPGVVDQTFKISPEDIAMDVDESGLSVHASQGGMDVLRQLHVLRLLKESEQFSWTSKSAVSSRSHLHIILSLYTRTPHPTVRAAASNLLVHLLSSSILFSHDPDEPNVWLSALPLTRRTPHAAAPDGTALLDEGSGVLDFLDDCIQRCIKTPYRYLEESSLFFSQPPEGNPVAKDTLVMADDPSMAPSPLLMTLLEQLRAKITANLVSPSDMLAIVTFIRKLIYSMTHKLSELQPAKKLQTRLEEICTLGNGAKDVVMIRDAIQGECELLSNFLGFIENPIAQPPVASSRAVPQFLEQVEKLPTPSSAGDRSYSAYELVDWMRLIRPELHPEDAKRLTLAVLRFSPAATKDFLDQLHPQHGHFWRVIEDNPEQFEALLPFNLAYLHATPSQIARSSTTDYLVSLFFSEAGGLTFKQKLSTVMQRLTASMRRNEELTPHLDISLLRAILNRAYSKCNQSCLKLLKRIIFSESKAIGDLCRTPDLSSSDLFELSALVRLALEPKSSSDKALARAYCAHWVAYLETARSLRSCVLASPWIGFMDALDVIRYLDVVVSAIQDGYQLSNTDMNATACILDTLTQFTTTPSLLKDLRYRLDGLLLLRSQLDQSSVLDTLLLHIVEAGLPLGYSALPLSMTSSLTVSDVTLAAQGRWKNSVSQLPLNPGLLGEILRSGNWTHITSRIVSGALYQSPAARQQFATWLSQNEPSEGSPLEIVATALHAFLYIASCRNEDSVEFPDPWFLALLRHMLNGQDSLEVLALCSSCVRMVLGSLPSKHAHYVDHLLTQSQKMTSGIINLPMLFLTYDLAQIDTSRFSALMEKLTDEGLLWMTGRFSEGAQTSDDLWLIQELTSLISRTPSKPHLVEAVVKSAIQNSLHIPTVIRSVTSLVFSTSLKPAMVNRLLQRIIQHSKLYQLATPSLPSRVPIVMILHALFHLQPANTCQPSHIVPLVRLYGGTLSFSDRLLFSIFYTYEKQRKVSVASLFHLWSPSSPGPECQGVLEAITTLDPLRVFRTCTSFPTRRRLAVTMAVTKLTEPDHGGEDEAYDPIFLVLLVVQLLAERKDLSATEWVQVFRSNTVSVVICALTSRDEALRNVALSTMAGLLQRVKHANFVEKEQTMYIMNMLQDILPYSAHRFPASRLPTHPAMVFAYALRSTFYPSSFLYPVISRFLLQRPELDTMDVPMLYSLLYSSEDGGNWIRERTWMIRFLTDSMREGDRRDWTVLKRRYSWDLVASMWQAARNDERSLRQGVLEFLANLSANSHSIMSLILRSAVLSWIELQLRSQAVSETETIAFVKILENILVTADVDKANNAMRGEFSATVARCLDTVLRGLKSSGSLSLLLLTSRVMIRLALQPSSNIVVLSQVLLHAVDVLRLVELSVAWTAEKQLYTFPQTPLIAQPLHRSPCLFDLSPTGNGIEIWGECVQYLWRVVMGFGDLRGIQECWDALTCRLLMIHTSKIDDKWDGKDMIGWGRRQVMESLLMSENTE